MNTCTRITVAAAAVVLAALAAACGRAPEPGGVVRLRYATPYGPTHPFSRGDAAWIRYVEHESRGRIVIEPYWGVSLIDESDSVRELAAGVADVSYILPIYL